MQETFICILVTATSAALYLFAVRKLRLEGSALPAAIRELAECIGASMVFFVMNMAIGVAAIFVIRGTIRFVGLYAMQDVILVVISAFQGFIFQIWWRRSRR